MNARDLIKYRYRLDRDDLLTWVDSWWLAFARENGARALNESTVLGRSLWGFIADDTTRRIYRHLHHRVRASGRPALVPFRCDSPTIRRHMRLTIALEPEQQLLYECVLVRVEHGEPCRVLDRDQPRCDAFLTLCSCCNRALYETRGWVELGEAAMLSGMLDSPRVPQLRYTVCGDCQNILECSAEPGNPA